MAELYEDDEGTRESWLMWAIELARRGLKPEGAINVHGPHGPRADYMWGEASCAVDGEEAVEVMPGITKGAWIEVAFRSGRVRPGRAAIWDLHSLRVWTKDDPEERWPIRRMFELSPDLRAWMKTARSERARLQARAKRGGRSHEQATRPR